MASVFGANPVEHPQHTQGAFSFHAVDQGPGPVVLLLAGWPQTNYAWRQVKPLLSGEYQAIPLDLKGQGEGSLDLDSDFSIEAVASEVAAYLEHRQLGPVRLVGHDVGPPRGSIYGFYNSSDQTLVMTVVWAPERITQYFGHTGEAVVQFPKDFNADPCRLEPFVTEAPMYGLNQCQYFMQYLYSIGLAAQATLAADDHLDEPKRLLETPLDQG